MKPTLTELVTRARWPKNPKTLQLEPHRKELLKLRRSGASISAINAGLRGFGIELSDEALRLWFKPKARGSKTRQGHPPHPAAGVSDVPKQPIGSVPVVEFPQPCDPAIATAPAVLAAAPQNPPGAAGETFREKLARLQATLPPRQPLLPRPQGPRIARDDI